MDLFDTLDTRTQDRRRSTGIEWTKHTWNPTVGCSIASAGCTNCYAMRQAWRIQHFGSSPAYNGLVAKAKNGAPVWTGKVGRGSDASMNKPRRIADPSVIFVNSMSDLFHPDMQDSWRNEAFEIMRSVDRHQYQILTKRPEVAQRYFERHPHFANLSNVWLGVSVERADAAWRIDHLRQCPAAVRFLSVEPIIGSLGALNLDGVHWVITGGESGPGARIVSPQYTREVRDQCIAQGVAFFHKQWGDWRANPYCFEEGMSAVEAKSLDLDPDSKGGAALDGELWRQMPQDIDLGLDGRKAK